MKYNKLAWILCAFTAGIFSLPAFENTHKKGDYVTPHIQWEIPSIHPKKKVLFFTKSTESIARYPAELAQRYNFEYELVYWHKSNTYGWVTDGQVCIGKEEGLLRAEELIQQGNWDCFVFWGSNPTTLLRNNKTAYLSLVSKIVRNGAGIVYVDSPGPDEKILKEKNILPPPPIPFFENGLSFKFYSIGKGLGASVMNFDTPEDKRTYLQKPVVTLPYCEGWRTQYEMRLADVYNIMKWSMKEKVSNAMKITGNVLEIVPSAPASIDVFIHGEGDTFQLLQNKVFTKNTPFQMTLPAFVPGKYMIGMIARQEGRVSEFCQLPYCISKNPAGSIKRLDLFAKGGKVGTKINGKIEWNGDGDMMLRLRDRDRRILREQKLTANGNTAELGFTIEDYMPHLITVEVSMMKDSKEIDRAYAYCYKTLHRPGKSSLMVWGDATYAIASIDLIRRCEELGIEEAVSATGPQLSPYEIISLPPLFQPRIEKARDEKACWLSKEKNDWINRVVSYQLKDYKDKGVDRVLFGDEGPVQLGCLCSPCQQEFRAYLKEKYKTLSSLNHAWKSNYNDWDKVGLSMIPDQKNGADIAEYGKEIFGTPDTAFSVHAIGGWNFTRARYWTQLIDIIKNNPRDREFYGDQYLMQDGAMFLSKNYVRWFDVCDFRSHVISKVFKNLDHAVKTAIPEASAGISGTAYVTRASDFDRFTDSLPWIIPYSHKTKGNPANDLISALTKKDYITGTWVGYDKDPKVSLEYLWNELLPRPGMIAIFSAMGSPPLIYGVFTPDLALNEMGRGILDATRQFRNGVADVLMQSDKRDDGIVILYSWPSNWAVHLENGNSFGEPGQDHTRALEMVESLSLKAQYMSAARLENGTGSLTGKKTVILPRTEAISSKQLRLLKEFAENGGTVIADIRPGVFMENLAIRDDKMSEACFGIKRNALSAKKSSKLENFAQNIVFDLDPGIETVTGKPLFKTQDGIPAVIVNPVGKGQFVLLNFPFHQMPSFENRKFADGPGKQVAEWFKKSLPAAVYFSTDGIRSYRINSQTWMNGDMTFLYALDSSITALPKDYDIMLERPKFVLDATAGKSYGKTSRFRFRLTPPNPSLFVLSEQPLPELALNIPSSVKKGDLVCFKCRVSGNMKGLRPAVLTMTHNGEKVFRFRHKLLLEPNETTVRNQIALNEKPGKYTVCLEDVLSGKVISASYEIK